jgi:uncharacterized membrane protein YozB (DUF420 family)
MSERQKQPWGVLIVALIVSAIGWLIVLSGALEATSAPQNFILILSKIGTVLSALGLLFLIVSRFWKPRA